MILVIKNIEVEGAGLIGEYFSGKGYELNTVELERGEELPGNMNGIEAVICLGGPMNVYEEEKFPFLRDEDAFIKKVLEHNVPFLGICLGAQLLAKASGARVTRSPNEEIGFFEIKLTPDGDSDALFKGISGDKIDVFQWHGDTFGIPEAGILLAEAELCRNQAFRTGVNAYGLQFHLEVDGNIISDWVKEYFDSGDPSLMKKAENMLTKYEEVKKNLHNNVEIICRNFEKIINSCRFL